ncbi:hypothetical protein [uncultured Victivallis sp.]|uniref:hypothetical protein n=1 Tax=uncultured Victivallis sp. TaxID=354118 RepID=UPI0025DF6941|nr:hypothetical protein [uncultured Victivallis sp.]
MNIESMNEKLQLLLEKYMPGRRAEVEADSSVGCGAVLCRDGKCVRLLPWRVERRFTELKAVTENGTLEGISTLRFAAMSAEVNLRDLLYRELDLCEFLGQSELHSAFAVVSGSGIANVLVKLADGKSASIECSAALPENTPAQDRHEIIARRGVASDRVVDTQVPQSSIYLFRKEGERCYTDVDSELYGLEYREIWIVRAAFAVIRLPVLAALWNRTDLLLRRKVDAVLNTAEVGRPVFFSEVLA